MTEETITRLDLNGKEIILIGSAHVSKHSADQVKEVIDVEQPDSVCIELDEQRYKSIREGNMWKGMDIFQVIKDKKATLPIINLAISAFENRVPTQLET